MDPGSQIDYNYGTEVKYMFNFRKYHLHDLWWHLTCKQLEMAVIEEE